MNESSEQIQRLTKLANEFSKTMRPHAENITKRMKPVLEQIELVSKAYAPVLDRLKVIAVGITKKAKKWQEDRKQDVVVMAESGWYPNLYTFYYEPEEEVESLDKLMFLHLEGSWNEITESILSGYPDRRNILETAFKLHQEGNYVASIPLFYSQADGICCEQLKSFLFTNNKVKEKLDVLVESELIEANLLTGIFLEPFKTKNHHNQGISRSGPSHKKKAPNRNGILHGHRKHLDYGTKTNSLKCFSLLAFVVFVMNDLIKAEE